MCELDLEERSRRFDLITNGERVSSTSMTIITMIHRFNNFFLRFRRLPLLMMIAYCLISGSFQEERERERERERGRGNNRMALYKSPTNHCIRQMGHKHWMKPAVPYIGYISFTRITTINTTSTTTTRHKSMNVAFCYIRR